MYKLYADAAALSVYTTFNDTFYLHNALLYCLGTL